MYSPSKKLDKQILLSITEMIEALVKIGTLEAIDLAERYGDTYLALEEKLKKFDYEEEDQKIEAFDLMFKNE